MNLKTFVSDMDRRQELAERLDCSPDYLWQLGQQWRGKRPSTDLARRIEKETAEMGHKVPRSALRPDVWGCTNDS